VSAGERIFVAGATGVLGARIVPLLVADGHRVAGLTRSPEKAAGLRALGAEPVVCDVFDAVALTEAVVAFRPEVVVDELTDLPDDRAEVASYMAANARMRRVGSANLLAAATAAGAGRVLAESVAWPLGGEGGDAVDEHERRVLAAGGVVLRYGRLYGPGTYFEDEVPSPPRIHVDEAARRTVAALGVPPGVLTLVEDEAPDGLSDAVRAVAQADLPRAQRARRLADLIRAETGRRWVGVYEVTATEVVNLAWSGPAGPAYPRFPVDKGLTGAAIRARAPVLSNDVARDPRYLTALASTGSELIVPVIVGGRVVGTLDVEDQRPGAFDDDDRRRFERTAAELAPLFAGA
jgi:putative methionine-R-sulfoxide reductase with GAF domain